MKLQSTIELNSHGSARVKPTYSNIGESGKLLTNVISDDFQQNVKNELLLYLSTHNTKEMFPVNSGISFDINVYTSRRIKLHGVIKNIMDACCGLIYDDDNAVTSAIIRKHVYSEIHDKVTLQIYTGTYFMRPDEIKYAAERFRIVDVEFDTVAADVYLPYPSNNTLKDIINPNEDEDLLIKAKLSETYKSGLLTGGAGISLIVDTSYRKVDVDNLSFNCIFGLQGIAYNDLYQLDMIHMFKRHRNCYKNNISIGVYEMNRS